MADKKKLQTLEGQDQACNREGGGSVPVEIPPPPAPTQ